MHIKILWSLLVILIFARPFPVHAQEGLPVFETTECPFQNPHGVDVQCGFLTVPEDRSLPDGPTIRLAGLVQPSAGTATIFGHAVTTAEGKQAVKSLLGYLPQELGLYPELSGREFLDYVGRLKGIADARARRQQIDELLVLVRLEEAANRRLKTYSGGMKRRVGIAQALLGDPRLLIVDEPTAGLDPEERVRLRNLLGEMSRRCAVILSTHIIEDINLSCSALAVLNKGQLLYHGAPRDLIAQARGKVWNILTDGEQPDSGLVIVSTQHMAEGLQYRVIGEPAHDYHASVVEPSLEDSYLWLMQHAPS